MTARATTPIRKSPLTLVCAGAAPFVAAGAPEAIDGVPRRRYLKELIRVGQYVKASEDLEFTVTPATLDNWVTQFRAMRKAGVRVPIPASHDGADDPDATRGWVDDMFVQGDSLYMSCTLVGDDAIVAAARNDVSIFSPHEFIDGAGNRYKRPIMHVALCPDPVVPGLGAFIPLAASLRLQRSQKMLELIQKIAAALGISEEVTEENAEQLLVPVLNALIARAKAEGGAQPAPGTAAPGAQAEGSGVATGGTASTVTDRTITDNLAASRSAAGPNAMVVRVLADNRRMRIDRAVEKGILRRPAAQRLIERYIGEGNAAVALAMSRGDAGDDFDAVMEAFEANGPVALATGTKTGPQLQPLPDPAKPGTGGNAMMRAVDAARRAAGCKD